MDLDLVETGDLIEALFRRSSVGVVLLTKHRDDDTDLEATAFIGNDSFCLGMCEAMSTKLRLVIENDFVAQQEAEE